MLRFESCIDMSIALMCEHDHGLKIKIMKRAGPIRMKVKEKGWAHYDIMKDMKGARAGPVTHKL